MPFNIIMRVSYYLESAPGVLTRKYRVYFYIYFKGNRLIQSEKIAMKLLFLLCTSKGD